MKLDKLFLGLGAAAVLLSVFHFGVYTKEQETTQAFQKNSIVEPQRDTNGQSRSNENNQPEQEKRDLVEITEDSLDLGSLPIQDLQEMITVLINDEYKARAEYVALVDEYGDINLFSNLIKAETNHIEALEVLFEAYNLDIPTDSGDDFAIVPETLEESYQIGVDAEIANIALYEGYLKQDLPEAVEQIFENLMNASEHHLSAFQRQLQ